MAETLIEWADYTFNPWIGCTNVAPGCQSCYAETFAKRYGKATWGPAGTRVKTSEANWRKPLKWNKEAEERLAARKTLVEAGFEVDVSRPRVFCASLADVFEDWDGPIFDHHGKVLHRWPNGDLVAVNLGEAAPFIPGQRANGLIAHPLTMSGLRSMLFDLIDATPHLDWLLLTKRQENVRRMWPMSGQHYDDDRGALDTFYRRNCWIGTSISDQPTADKAIPELLKCRDLSRVLFLSAEPLLGPIQLPLGDDVEEAERRATGRHGCGIGMGGAGIDWVIVGGESGGNARPMNTTWVWSIVQQCKAAGVACFVKQMGANSYLCVGHDRPLLRDDGPPVDCLGEAESCFKFRFSGKKGGDMSEWPEGLRVREFPEVVHADNVH